MLLETFKYDFKGALRVSKRSSKGVSRDFQKHFMEVSRLFKETVKFISRKFHKKFQGWGREGLFLILLAEYLLLNGNK